MQTERTMKLARPPVPADIGPPKWGPKWGQVLQSCILIKQARSSGRLVTFLAYSFRFSTWWTD
jgi:hypothetical protein